MVAYELRERHQLTKKKKREDKKGYQRDPKGNNPCKDEKYLKDRATDA